MLINAVRQPLNPRPSRQEEDPCSCKKVSWIALNILFLGIPACIACLCTKTPKPKYTQVAGDDDLRITFNIKTPPHYQSPLDERKQRLIFDPGRGIRCTEDSVREYVSDLYPQFKKERGEGE